MSSDTLVNSTLLVEPVLIGKGKMKCSQSTANSVLRRFIVRSLFRNTIGDLVVINVNKFILRHSFERHHIGQYSDITAKELFACGKRPQI